VVDLQCTACFVPILTFAPSCATLGLSDAGSNALPTIVMQVSDLGGLFSALCPSEVARMQSGISLFSPTVTLVIKVDEIFVSLRLCRPHSLLSTANATSSGQPSSPAASPVWPPPVSQYNGTLRITQYFKHPAKAMMRALEIRCEETTI
jgi:hypothetical protein